MVLWYQCIYSEQRLIGCCTNLIFEYGMIIVGYLSKIVLSFEESLVSVVDHHHSQYHHHHSQCHHHHPQCHHHHSQCHHHHSVQASHLHHHHFAASPPQPLVVLGEQQ